jgi:hypothetical protein
VRLVFWVFLVGGGGLGRGRDGNMVDGNTGIVGFVVAGLLVTGSPAVKGG